MKILAYHELEQKEGLLPLMEQAFGWPFDPLEFEKNIRIDSRLRNGMVGLCAVEGERVVGYVGVMDLATKGEGDIVENVGGIYGVATLPGYTRRGICRALLEQAHEYFNSKNYRFSFLATSPTIVAYSLYKEQGYSDVTSFPAAYKILHVKSKQKSEHKSARLDLDRMLDLFHKYVRGKTGFVVRDIDHAKMLVKTLGIAKKDCMFTNNGYVIFKREKKLVRIRELVASNEREMSELIGLVEGISPDLIYARAILDPALRKTYGKCGFSVLESGHGLLMVKELEDVSFMNVYGANFYMSGLDHF